MESRLDYIDLFTTLTGQRLGRVGMSGNVGARCPLHQDRTPSFTMNVENGLWYCHSEQRGGTFEHLVAEYLDIGLIKAQKWVIGHSGLATLVDSDSVWGTIQVEEQTVLETEMMVYEATDKTEMSQYWFDRGFGWDDMRRWGARYVHPEIWIPYRFPFNGPIIGFVKRSCEVAPKVRWRNTYGMEKHLSLFNLGARELGDVLIVEGVFDAMRADQAGYAAVAILGAQVSGDQMYIIGRMGYRRLIIALDDDEIGRGGLRRVIYSSDSLSGLYVFRYPEGVKDVGDCTVEQVAEGVASAEDALLYSWNLEKI